MALDKVEQRIGVFAVHAIDGMSLSQQRGADFQGGEVRGHEDHALAFRLRLLQVFQPLDMSQLFQPRLRPPPAHRHLEQGNATGGEVVLEQARPLRGRQLRKAQFQIARDDFPPLTGEHAHQRPQCAAQHQQNGIRQLRHQPERAHA
ncbi:hypothetical protein D3C77_573540 [compost metagenome]